MRILVTGASGYIGSVLVPFLSGRGHEIETLDLGLYDACSFIGDRVVSDRRDVRDAERSWLAEFDAVVHLAALSNDPVGDLDPGLTYEINHQASVRLARAAKDAGVPRFVFASSCSLYGAAGEEILDEGARFAPVTAYGESKVATEAALHRLADDGFSPILLRNATVYGTSPALRLDVVVNNLVAWAVATGKIVLRSDGTPWRPQVHVEDVAGAVLAVLEAPREVVHDEAFNVGVTGENYQVREIAGIVAEAVPGAELSISPDAGPDVRSYRVDFTKIREKVPGFEPVWDVPAGVAQLVEAFTAEGMSEDDFARYTRLAEIKRLQERGLLDGRLRWR